MDEEVYKRAIHYCVESYQETIDVQLFLANEGSVPLTYSDSISFSEMHYIFERVKNMLEQKQEALKS